MHVCGTRILQLANRAPKVCLGAVLRGGRWGEGAADLGRPRHPPCQVAGELKYHPECFICLTCGTFIGDGDTYTLVEHSKLYW